MSKAILVLDEMPVNCSECLCLDTTDIIHNGGKFAYCWALNKPLKNVSKDEFIYVKKPKKCPLKPMPEKKEIEKCDTWREMLRAESFNEIIDEILGGK